MSKTNWVEFEEKGKRHVSTVSTATFRVGILFEGVV
jgi:hypothetical protein